VAEGRRGKRVSEEKKIETAKEDEGDGRLGRKEARAGGGRRRRRAVMVRGTESGGED